MTAPPVAGVAGVAAGAAGRVAAVAAVAAGVGVAGVEVALARIADEAGVLAVGINPIVTLEKWLLSMIDNIV
jgi:hypothetical protein